MAIIYYCPKCKSTYGGEGGSIQYCSDCNTILVDTNFDRDKWRKLSNTEREHLIVQWDSIRQADDNRILLCRRCGRKVERNAQFCSDCGIKLIADDVQQGNMNSGNRVNTMCVVGLIISIVSLLVGFWGVGLLVSIIGLTQSNKNGERGQGYAITGIIIEIVPFLAGVFHTLLNY